jgi:uncharacterized repeat protein (TIGR03803 family)
MKSKTILRGLFVAVVLHFGVLAGSAQTGVVFTSLYSFSGTNDGVGPNGLVQGSDGSFYGTTLYGGGNFNNDGTVFNITTNGALTSLYSFRGTNDGENPDAGLVQGSDGNFYGTTDDGGTNNFGTVFKISTNGALTSLYSFTGGSDGAYPLAGLVQGSDGNLYGSTAGQAFMFASAIFKISTNGALTTLYTFNPPLGGNPSRLVQGSDGSFYGTTLYGGGNFNSDGTVFNISTNGALTNLYSFSGKDGAIPRAGLVQGSDGNFYGTTEIGGNTNLNSGFGYGTVFKVTTNGTLTSLYSFGGTNDGNSPSAGLVQGSDGNFYGTTPVGGNTNLNYGQGFGTVFTVTTNGTLTSLYSFSGTNDGSSPNGLVQGSDGSFYGTTRYGGTNNAGTVFRLTIQPQLTMTVSGAFITLSWPTNYAGWYLQRTVNLGAAGFVRITLPGLPVIVNGQFVVTLPITDPQQGYYRLSSQ